MEKKDQTKILAFGSIIVIILIGLMSWIINIHEPSKSSNNLEKPVSSSERGITGNSDTSSFSRDSGKTKSNKKLLMKRKNSFPKTEN